MADSPENDKIVRRGGCLESQKCERERTEHLDANSASYGVRGFASCGVKTQSRQNCGHKITTYGTVRLIFFTFCTVLVLTQKLCMYFVCYVGLELTHRIFQENGLCAQKHNANTAVS